MNEANATPHAELIAELMNPNIPKNEREHAAVREIERLCEALAQPAQEGLLHIDRLDKWLDASLKERAQPAQQPVANQCKGIPRKGCNYLTACDRVCNKCGEIHHHHQMVANFTFPPQRPWVGLDEQDFSAINQSCLTKLQAAISAESVLKEKNT